MITTTSNNHNSRESNHTITHMQCLMKAFHNAGMPVLFLFTLCVGLGLLFVLIGSNAGIPLIIAGASALVLFVLLGSGNCSNT